MFRVFYSATYTSSGATANFKGLSYAAVRIFYLSTLVLETQINDRGSACSVAILFCHRPREFYLPVRLFFFFVSQHGTVN
jgi:hypothetical protein